MPLQIFMNAKELTIMNNMQLTPQLNKVIRVNSGGTVVESWTKDPEVPGSNTK